ncbi:MAG: hypothetical protein IT260_03925 [Saprospiraceae bacterium]|nr:hypothetical protein [Saprospiraceae bacterium]
MTSCKAVSILVALFLSSQWLPAQILDPDRVGKKVENKVERKVDKTVDKSVDKVLDAPENKIKNKKNPPPAPPVRVLDLYGQLPPDVPAGYGYTVESKVNAPVSGPLESVRKMDIGVPPGVVVPAGTQPVTLIFKGGSFKLADQTSLSEDLWITFLFTGKAGSQSVVKSIFGDCKLNGQVSILNAAGLQITECKKSSDKPGMLIVSGVFQLDLSVDKNSACKKSNYAKGVKVTGGYFTGLLLPFEAPAAEAKQ